MSLTHYDPNARFAVQTRDVEYLRVDGVPLLARLYQPQGGGPFPALLDIHGGAWNIGDRMNDDAANQALAASGLLVMAIDFRLAPGHPYPAQVADQHYATRWLKAHAAEFGGDPTTVGAVGSSSGGHTIMLSAMRPADPRYAAIPLPEAPDVDASLAYIVNLWPVVDPYARYRFAQSDPAAGTGFGGPDTLQRRTLGFFGSEAAMQEGNPQLILDRGEPVLTPPMLVIHPTADLNVPRPMVERFIASYRAAGGEVEARWFEGMTHAFMREPGPETDQAVAVIKDYIARRLAALAVAA